MNEQNEKKEKKEGDKGTFSPIAIVALLLFTLVESGENALVSILFLALMVGAVVYVLYKGVSRFVKKDKGEEEETFSARRQENSTEYTAPDAHCVVCENTGEDHFARDQAQRIKQLDEWLENGMIDKNEYKELKERYEEKQ